MIIDFQLILLFCFFFFKFRENKKAIEMFSQDYIWDRLMAFRGKITKRIALLLRIISISSLVLKFLIKSWKYFP